MTWTITPVSAVLGIKADSLCFLNDHVLLFTAVTLEAALQPRHNAFSNPIFPGSQ